ncbi:MAG: phosphocholine cytidylyltransferase family protein [Legionellales bacterium]|nr:phosphocholine cytidylyltransferase family protein [Legionellales bacterium]
MTQALILSAGQGTRLRPYTINKPKCLVKLLGIPIIERQLSVLRENNISKISIAAGYCAEQLEYLGLPIILNEQFASTNMVDTFFKALKKISSNEDLIVAYGDIVYENKNLKAILSSDSEINIMIDKQWRKYWEARLDDPLQDAETLILADDKNILEIGKKPLNYDSIHGQYTGLIKIRKDNIPLLVEFYQGLDRSILYDEQIFQKMHMTSFLQLLIDNGWQVQATLVENGWLETDTAFDLELYESLYRKGELSQFCDLD